MSGECCWCWETRLGKEKGLGKEANGERKGPNLGSSIGCVVMGKGGQRAYLSWRPQEILRLDIWAGDEEGRDSEHLGCCYPSDQ